MDCSLYFITLIALITPQQPDPHYGSAVIDSCTEKVFGHTMESGEPEMIIGEITRDGYVQVINTETGKEGIYKAFAHKINGHVVYPIYRHDGSGGFDVEKDATH